MADLTQMRTFAAALAEVLQAGDLVILTGNLGAGKTTLTQSLGRALDVAGRITSPTFVIARAHPSRRGGPTLVHVDAYRLADGEELEDLDLDSDLDESITVVEWGAGLAEQLSADYLEVTIRPVWAVAGAERGDGPCADGDGALAEAAETESTDAEIDDERRMIDVHGHGATWDDRLQRLRTQIAKRLDIAGERP